MDDERVLAERLISYDTSRPEEIVAAAGFVKGWLESRDIAVEHVDHHGLPVLTAQAGPQLRLSCRASSSTAISMSCRGSLGSSSRASTATAWSAAAPTT